MNRSHFVWLKVRVKVRGKVNLFIPLVLPLPLLLGLVSYIEDMVQLLTALGVGGTRIARLSVEIEGFTKGDAHTVCYITSSMRKMVRQLMRTEPFDLADVDVETDGAIVKVRFALV